MKPLSPNEGYIVSRLLQYAQRKKIAAEMGVKEKTLNTYLHRAREKYGAGSTAELLQIISGAIRVQIPAK